MQHRSTLQREGMTELRPVFQSMHEPVVDAPLAKFLNAFNATIRKVIERVGHRVQCAPISQLMVNGIEKEHGQLEMLISIIQQQEYL